MHSGLLALVTAAVTGGVLLVALPVAAQGAPAEPAPPATGAASAAGASTAAPGGGDTATVTTSAGDEDEPATPVTPAGSAEERKKIADAEAGGSPVELPGKTYHFLGLRYRGYIVPKFMQNMFGADGGRTVYVHDFGPEFAIRKDGFEYLFALTYADYGMKPTPFKASSDPDTAWEIIESEIKMIQLTADFLWSQEFSPEFSLNYGMGAGLGIVWGDLFRTQSYPGGASDPYDYKPCVGKGSPDASYCGDDNDHYNGYKEASWADGGSKPIVFPLLMLETGLRYKPHRNFAARLDLGFGTSGFIAGLGLDYGL